MPNHDTLFFLPVSHAQNILFRSFLLSQGDGDIQRRLLRYLALTHPTWRIAREAEQDLTVATLRVCTRFLTSGWHREMTASLIETEVREYIEEFCVWLREDPRTESPLLLCDLMVDIIRRDYYYLVTTHGRPRTISPSDATPRAPYFSHFCHYGLLRRPTGVVEFDALFLDIARAFHEQGDILLRCLAQPAGRHRIKHVLEVHNTHYPEQAISLSPHLRSLLEEASPSAEKLDEIELLIS